MIKLNIWHKLIFRTNLSEWMSLAREVPATPALNVPFEELTCVFLYLFVVHQIFNRMLVQLFHPLKHSSRMDVTQSKWWCVTTIWCLVKEFISDHLLGIADIFLLPTGNIIMDVSQQRVYFIDLEYASLNPLGFEIANHFAEVYLLYFFPSNNPISGVFCHAACFRLRRDFIWHWKTHEGFSFFVLQRILLSFRLW